MFSNYVPIKKRRLVSKAFSAVAKYAASPIVCCLAYLAFFGILYKPVGAHPILLFTSIVFGVLFAAVFLIDIEDSIPAALSVLAFTFGIYTIMGYWVIAREMILFAICATVALIFVRLAYLHSVGAEEGLRDVCRTIYFTAVLTFSVMMAVLGVNIAGFCTIIKPTVSAIRSDSGEQTIDDNIETLALLEKTRWTSLSARKKLNVLQTVANIEQSELGLPNKLRVGVLDLPENTEYRTEGGYNDEKHLILIDEDSLLHSDPCDLVNTVTHEAFHGYEYRMVDSYDIVIDSLKDSYYYQRAAEYKEEFADYTDGFDNFDDYYNQVCEEDSRTYAEEETQKYISAVNNYLGISYVSDLR